MLRSMRSASDRVRNEERSSWVREGGGRYIGQRKMGEGGGGRKNYSHMYAIERKKKCTMKENTVQ